ncbi:Effector protein NopP [Bradyrhizobium erythrophlei]|uniref:Effector protein NopP n=1 Tax=Bradyrhizobium erythrophlei TaxID=1437360 RepID=UPI0035EE231B
MYNRIDGSSYTQFPSVSDADDADGQRFADMFDRMHVAAPSSYASSSSAATRPYSLVSKPPIVEISRSSFERKVEDFHGDEIGEIAANPQRYSSRVSSKAERTAQIAYRHGGTQSDSANARYFSYQLGDKSVGLLRAEGGRSMSGLFDGDEWREQFPGRTHTTSTVDFRVTHPLVDNAGDILLEHQLRQDGDRPLLLSHSFNPEAKDRAAELGFVKMSDSLMVLDPTQHPDKWTKNSNGEWQRANKPPLYLSKANDSEGRNTEDSERAPGTSPDLDDYDFM